MGWSNVGAAVIEATTVIVSGTTGGVFVYSGTPAAGTLRQSIAAAAGTDPYGNSYPAGFATYDSSSNLIGLMESTGSLIELFNSLGQTIGTWGQSGLTIQFTDGITGHINLLSLTLTPAITFFSQDLLSLTSDAVIQMNVINAGLVNEYGQLYLAGPTGFSEPFGYIKINSASDDATIPANIALSNPAVIDGETWHAVPLVNSWANVGGAFQTAQYRQMNDGTIMIRGAIQNGTSTTIATLPAGYRPPATVVFPVGGVSVTAGQMLRVGITSAGVMTINSEATLGTPFELDGIRFSLT